MADEIADRMFDAMMQSLEWPYTTVMNKGNCRKYFFGPNVPENDMGITDPIVDRDTWQAYKISWGHLHLTKGWFVTCLKQIIFARNKLDDSTDPEDIQHWMNLLARYQSAIDLTIRGEEPRDDIAW